MLTRATELLHETFPPGTFTSVPAAGQRRAISANVIVYFAFALVALIFLTKSAIAAHAIDREVRAAIAPVTQEIDASTSRIPQLDRTIKITDRIAAGTKDLSGHLDGVVSSTDRIDANLGQVRADVDEIGTSVDGINGTVAQIRPEIFTLGDSISGVHSKAGTIDSALSQTASDTSAMNRSLANINQSLASIAAGTTPLKGDVAGIKSTVSTISGHTKRIARSPILATGRGLFQGLPLDVLGSLGLGDLGLDDLLRGAR